jgi:hypothetical protein
VQWFDELRGLVSSKDPDPTVRIHSFSKASLWSLSVFEIENDITPELNDVLGGILAESIQEQ